MYLINTVVEIHGSRGAPLNDYIPDLQKMRIFSIALLLWQIPKNKCHQSVYLDDADDFYFWICQKIFTRKKVTSVL